MQNSEIKRNRINQLFRLATKGSNKNQIVNKALSMGVSRRTANDYYETVHAMLIQVKNDRNRI